MKRSSRIAVVLAAVVTGAALLQVQGAHAAPKNNSGFTQPYLGTLKFAPLAAKELTSDSQLNAQLGPKKAKKIAAALRLTPLTAFTQKQYDLFVSGGGVGGDPNSSALLVQSMQILTNTTGRPLTSTVNGQTVETTLASYGLMVSPDGMIESPANKLAPPGQVNSLIEPGGYLEDWCKANGAAKVYKALYASAFTAEAIFGSKAQGKSGVAQLVPNVKAGVKNAVGMPMAPSIWIANFALIYQLDPKLVQYMPAKWAPIPAQVAAALEASSTGQVPWSEYGKYLPQG